MVRFTVPIADILGNAYYRYEMTASNYNPSIDSTITISVIVKNVFGNPVDDKSLTLLNNGGSVGTATTNANGVATFSYTFSDWDIHHFSCNGATLELQANGWKIISSQTNYTILANGKYVRIDFKQGSNTTVPHTYSYTIPSGYRPKYNCGAISSSIGDDGVHFATFSATTTGGLDVKLRRNTYNTGVNTIYGQLIYPY